jgi:hypothetical protein
MTTLRLCTQSDLRPMRATTIIRLAAQAGMTIEVRADRGRAQQKVTKKDSSTKRSQRSQRRGFGFIPRPRILREIRPIDPMPGISTTSSRRTLLLLCPVFGGQVTTLLGISELHWLEILFFRKDSRLVRRAALKHRSARLDLASKTIEQEGTEGSPLSLFAPVP